MHLTILELTWGETNHSVKLTELTRTTRNSTSEPSVAANLFFFFPRFIIHSYSVDSCESRGPLTFKCRNTEGLEAITNHCVSIRVCMGCVVDREMKACELILSMRCIMSLYYRKTTGVRVNICNDVNQTRNHCVTLHSQRWGLAHVAVQSLQLDKVVVGFWMWV